MFITQVAHLSKEHAQLVLLVIKCVFLLDYKVSLLIVVRLMIDHLNVKIINMDRRIMYALLILELKWANYGTVIVQDQSIQNADRFNTL